MLDADYPTLWSQPTFKMEKTDSLMEATLLAFETGDLTPLVKEELKYTIMSRRLANGEGEMGVEFKDSTPSELTEDEKQKIVRRREQNRLAARRFRQRRRAKGPYFKKTIQELESDNTSKITEIRRLRKEKAELQALLQSHLTVCPSMTMQTG